MDFTGYEKRFENDYVVEYYKDFNNSNKVNPKYDEEFQIGRFIELHKDTKTIIIKPYYKCGGAWCNSAHNIKDNPITYKTLFHKTIK